MLPIQAASFLKRLSTVSSILQIACFLRNFTVAISQATRCHNDCLRSGVIVCYLIMVLAAARPHVYSYETNWIFALQRSAM
jgi:hypothetical protein